VREKLSTPLRTIAGLLTSRPRMSDAIHPQPKFLSESPMQFLYLGEWHSPDAAKVFSDSNFQFTFGSTPFNLDASPAMGAVSGLRHSALSYTTSNRSSPTLPEPGSPRVPFRQRS
jgi:hypothetical protein